MTHRPLKKNFAINLSGPLVRIVVALIIVPIYLHAVGAARYGVISILWSLVGYSGFLDLGLSRASANALAKMRAAPQAERARVMFTTLVVNLMLGLSGGFGLFLAAGWLLGHFISAPPELRPEIARALPWIAVMILRRWFPAFAWGRSNRANGLRQRTSFKFLVQPLGRLRRCFSL